MSRWTLVVALALAGGARAELHCPVPTHDAGSVRGGATVAHVFVLTNRGASVLDITDAKPACGCLVAELDRPTLQPGEQARLSVRVNTLTQAAGPNRWGTRVRYLVDGQPREVALGVNAVVVPEVRIEPAHVVLYTDSRAEHAFTLTEFRDKPLHIEKALAGSPHVRVRVSQPERKDGAWVRRVRLSVAPTCPEGRHEDRLQLITGDPERPELHAPFTVVKRTPGRVTASPSLLELAGAVGEPLPARVVLLGGPDEERVLVEKVETTHPAIRCTFAEGPGPRSTLRVTVDREQVGKNGIGGQVRVHLSKPTAQVVTIPVQAR